jgi:hypothetical protein
MPIILVQIPQRHLHGIRSPTLEDAVKFYIADGLQSVTMSQAKNRTNSDGARFLYSLATLGFQFYKNNANRSIRPPFESIFAKIGQEPKRLPAKRKKLRPKKRGLVRDTDYRIIR